MNQVSHFLDGSTIYGSTLVLARELRTFENGKLLVKRNGDKDYLPDAERTTTDQCRMNGPCYKAGKNFADFPAPKVRLLSRIPILVGISTKSSSSSIKWIFFLFIRDAGDDRANFEPSLAVLHTLWHREHNRIAEKLRELNPLWSDEIIYQETRRIVIAEIQHITYNEWLPIVVGRDYVEAIGLGTGQSHSSDYSSHDDPSVSNEAANAVFRFFNSLKQGQLRYECIFFFFIF